MDVKNRVAKTVALCALVGLGIFAAGCQYGPSSKVPSLQSSVGPTEAESTLGKYLVLASNNAKHQCGGRLGLRREGSEFIISISYFYDCPDLTTRIEFECEAEKQGDADAPFYVCDEPEKNGIREKIYLAELDKEKDDAEDIVTLCEQIRRRQDDSDESVWKRCFSEGSCVCFRVQHCAVGADCEPDDDDSYPPGDLTILIPPDRGSGTGGTNY